MCINTIENYNYTLRAFENRVLRVIFGFKRQKVVGDWRRLHDKELHKLYASQNIIRVIKSRRIRQVGHVASIKEINSYKNFVFPNVVSVQKNNISAFRSSREKG
jgi:hypothetical protein